MHPRYVMHWLDNPSGFDGGRLAARCRYFQGAFSRRNQMAKQNTVIEKVFQMKPNRLFLHNVCPLMRAGCVYRLATSCVQVTDTH